MFCAPGNDGASRSVGVTALTPFAPAWGGRRNWVGASLPEARVLSDRTKARPRQNPRSRLEDLRCHYRIGTRGWRRRAESEGSRRVHGAPAAQRNMTSSRRAQTWRVLSLSRSPDRLRHWPLERLQRAESEHPPVGCGQKQTVTPAQARSFAGADRCCRSPLLQRASSNRQS